MARADAAKEDAHAHKWRPFALAIWPLLAQGRAQRIYAQTLLYYVAPVVAALIFSAAAFAIIEDIRASRERALSAAEHEVDLRAALIASRMNEALAANPQSGPNELLRGALDDDATLREGAAIVADADGGVIASEPPKAPGVTLTSLLGQGHALTGRCPRR